MDFSLCLVRAFKRTREICTCDEHVVTDEWQSLLLS